MDRILEAEAWHKKNMLNSLMDYELVICFKWTTMKPLIQGCVQQAKVHSLH